MTGSSTITVRVLTESDDPHWEEALSQSSQASWLQWLPWHRCCGRLCRGSVALGVERGGELIAGLAGLEVEEAGRRALHNNYLTSYHGLWLRDIGLRPAKAETLLTEVAQVLVAFLDQRYASWAFSNAPELWDARPFRDLGCQVGVYWTYRVTLGEPEAMLAQFEKEARRWVRHAAERGASFEVCAPSEENLAAFESHILATAGRQRFDVALVPRGLFAEIAGTVHRAGCGQLFMARTGDRPPAASVLCTWDDRRAFSFLGGATPEAMAAGLPRFLDFKAFEWLHAHGHREVDLLGANLPGLRAFKKDYNGVLLPYLTISREHRATVGRRGHLKIALKHLVKAVRA
jgi:hypothetical protein